MADQTRSFDLELSPDLQRGQSWRLLVALALVAYFVIGFRVGPMLSGNRGVSLRTPLDDQIPFLPWTIYFYASFYVALAYPLFVVRCPRLFDRVAMAYFAVLSLCFVCYLVFPVTAVGFRPDPSILDDHVFHEWGLKLTYALDEPSNLFPSLHLSMAVMLALAAWKASPWLGALALPLVAGVTVAIFTVKQHYLADGVAALGLAAGVYYWILRPYPDRQVAEEERSNGWRGVARFAVFHAGVLLACYVAFRLGVKAW